ncbi:ASCH domain-containing protein [Pseudomonas luteola]
MRILTLPLKRQWFEEIKAGVKREEYRERKAHWSKKLVGKDYDFIVLTLGYPHRDDHERRLVLPWQGYVEKTIIHPHFNNVPVDVYAIDVSGKPLQPDALAVSA